MKEVSSNAYMTEKQIKMLSRVYLSQQGVCRSYNLGFWPVLSYLPHFSKLSYNERDCRGCGEVSVIQHLPRFIVILLSGDKLKKKHDELVLFVVCDCFS